MQPQSAVLLSTDARRGGTYPWVVVVLLGLCVILSYIDRFVMNLLAEHIKHDIGLSDTQMSLLMGAAFAVFYGIFGVPIAWLADRFSRKWIIVVGIVVWSAMTSFIAGAKSFASIFVLRIGVGVGEAALSPAALSMISDLFPSGRRSLPTSVFLAFGVIGGGASMMLVAAILNYAESAGGIHLPVLGALEVWQFTFLVVGIPGVLLALLLALVVREPARTGGTDEIGSPARAAKADKASASFRQVLEFMRVHGAFFIPLFLGISLMMMVNFGLSAWVPTLLVRLHGLTMAETGARFGFVGLLANVSGMLLVPWLAQQLSRRSRAEGTLRAGLLCVAIGAPCAIVAPLLSSPWPIVLAYMPVFTFLSGLAALPAIAVQEMVPNRIRAQMVALYYLAVNLIGMGLGPTVVALITDYGFRDEAALGRSLALVPLLVAPLCVTLFIYSYRNYRFRKGRSS